MKQQNRDGSLKVTEFHNPVGAFRRKVAYNYDHGSGEMRLF